jgi:MFS family permease
VSGALTLLIPLLLIERKMNIAEIGMILSVLPLVFLVARLSFASIADYVGWSHIFLFANWPTSVGSIIIYYFATSSPIFLAGKIAEGLRESSYWAVIRTAIYQVAPQKAAKEATKNNAILWIATAVGSAVVGLSIGYIGFSLSLAVLALISLFIGIPALMLWKSNKKIDVSKNGKAFAALIPKGRTKLFWIGSLALMFNSLSAYPLVTLLLPAYMNLNLGYDYLTIGLLFLFYNAVAGVAAFFSLRKPLSSRLALALTVLSIVASVFLTLYNTAFTIALLVLAFVRGYGIGYFEYTIIKVTRNSSNISVDIGLIHMPQRIAEFASLMFAGYLAQTIGYAPVFVALGSCFGLYALIALYVIRRSDVAH